MADKAHKQTEADIKALEKRLKSVYSTAQSDLKKKWDKCMDRMQKASESKYNAYMDALKSGDKAKAEEAKKAYQDTLKKMTAENWYKEQMDVITDEMTRLNERALAYTKDKVPKVYKQNYNAVGSSVSKQIPGYSFHMVDENTVKRMTKRLASKKINVHKDKRWNTKKANSQIMQGILQGESIGTIAKRLENVTNSTFKGALRTARTMMTEAQNAGRMDSYEQMEEDGLIVHKVWVATPDNHVRDTHLALDGQEVDIHEPFETIDGNELMYPGDPDGAPEEIYNCRCTMITHIVGFIDDNGVEHSLDYLDESDAHAEAIEREKEERDMVTKSSEEIQEVEKGDYLDMSEQEYEQWYQKNKTSDRIEKVFEEEYGMTIREAENSFGRDPVSGKDYYDLAREYNGLTNAVTRRYGCGYIQNSDGSKAINAYLRRGEVKMYSKRDMQETIDAMKRLISITKTEEDMIVDRWAGIEALERMGVAIPKHGRSFRIGHSYCTKDLDYTAIEKELNKSVIGAVITDDGFMSASACETLNVFRGSDVRFRVQVPKGTNAYISDNTRESELVFSPGTKQEIQSVNIIDTEAVNYDGEKESRKAIEIFVKIIKE